MSLPFFGSMTARIFVILVAGTLAAGTLILTLAAHERGQLDLHIRMLHAAQRMEQLILTLDVVPPASRAAVIRVAERYGARIATDEPVAVTGMASDSGFATELRRTLGGNRHIRVLEDADRDCTIPVPGRGAAAGSRCETIVASLVDGTPLTIDIAHPDRAPPPFMEDYPRDLLLLLTAFILLAFVVAHMATKPLRRLAQAARELGRNIGHPPLPEHEGSMEVREAAAAFNTMQARIHSHLQERTCMLAAVAHDLQTPLTRLRLRLEKVSDPELRARLVADMNDTQKMVSESLEFARTLGEEERLELVDLDSLVAAICSDAIDAGCDVRNSGQVGQPVLAAPHALRRCISNLVENAIKYGKLARVSVSRTDHVVRVSIADAGPGIPEACLEAVFQPFSRCEGAHGGSARGTGLGLAIARIVAEKHRGTVTLDNSGSGLVATLELPLP
jgi:signal transduction histidine kinase